MKMCFKVLMFLLILVVPVEFLSAQTVKIPSIGSSSKNPSPAANQKSAAPNSAPQTPPMPLKSPGDAKETNEVQSERQEIEEAKALYAKGDIQGAKKKFDDARQKYPELQPAGLFIAQLVSGSGQLSEVRYWLEVAAYESPDDPEAFLQLGNFAGAENRLTEAALLAERAAELLEKNIPKDSKRYKPLQIGTESLYTLIAMSRRDWKAAKEHLTTLLPLAPDNPKHLTDLGYVCFHLQNPEDSLKYFEEAIQKGAKIPHPKLLVAQMQNLQGHREEAVQTLSESLPAMEKDAAALRLAASFSLLWGNLGQAEKLIKQAVSVEPKHIENLTIQGTIALYKKDYTQAEKYFQDAVLTAPNDLMAKQGLALALAESSDKTKYDRAVAYAKDIVQNSPQQPANAVAVLAWICQKTGHLAEVEILTPSLLQNAAELNPLGLYFLAEILASQEKNKEAVELLKRATDHNDSFFKKNDAEALLKKLESAPK
ncbi:MAG: tetratricopeptide repeat protein [Planctomycetaceae bacterium]|jgi:tetratricopeptide (TPR) repeat protein|nr:tetratricopeptide repeat protein [Planctomycetaceae bacterium]